ncbi:MAG: helix-turn-helix domain-containing protein [Chlorobia bacterium]|nr:helix-turn-helix domain-containing protein [Fimbriimonadaceae bacterium]
MRTNEFDPLAYIENGFLDTKESTDKNGAVHVAVPTIKEYLGIDGSEPAPGEDANSKPKFRKTVMSAPRPRRSRNLNQETSIDPQLQVVWETLPKNIEFLCGFFDDAVTSNYYRGEFKESREELIRRLLDPELTLEETSRLLGVCPATVRRYTNRKWLTHHRTQGGQRRFRLSDVVKFVEAHGRFPEV